MLEKLEISSFLALISPLCFIARGVIFYGSMSEMRSMLYLPSYNPAVRKLPEMPKLAALYATLVAGWHLAGRQQLLPLILHTSGILLDEWMHSILILSFESWMQNVERETITESGWVMNMAGLLTWEQWKPAAEGTTDDLVTGID